MRTLDPEPDPYVLDRARTAVAEAFPLFQNMAIAERWGGMIDVMPDAIPVISPVDSVPGFFIATGFSGHGFGIGPGAGKLIADMVGGRPDPGRSRAVPVDPLYRRLEPAAAPAGELTLTRFLELSLRSPRVRRRARPEDKLREAISRYP